MSKTRRNKNHVPDKKEGKKTGSRPISEQSDALWDEDEDEESEDEDEDEDDWEPAWPDEGDELQASGWDDDLLMDR